MPLPTAGPLNYSKAGNRQRATCSATLLQNELNSDVPRFATCVQTCFATNKVVRVFFVGGKRRKIAIQLVLQQSRQKVARFLLPVTLKEHSNISRFDYLRRNSLFRKTKKKLPVWLIHVLYSYFEKGCRKKCVRDNPER